MIMDKRSVAVIQLVFTGILWSLSGLFIKSIALHPFAISSIRSAFAALVLLTYIKFRPKFSFSKAQIIGALCYVGTVSLFVFANKTTTAANAILLQYGAPIYVAFLGYWILSERLRWFDYVAVAGIAVGMIVFFADSVSGGGTLGNILAALSGFTFAAQAVCVRLQKDGGGFETILLGNLIAMAIGIPFVITGPPSVAQMPPLMFLGIFQLGVAYLLYSLASRNVTALDMMIIPMLEPILNPVWVFIFLGERPGVFALIGGTIVFIAVGFKSYFSLSQSAFELTRLEKGKPFVTTAFSELKPAVTSERAIKGESSEPDRQPIS